MLRLTSITAAALASLAIAASATPTRASDTLTVVESRFPVAESLDRLAAALKERGIGIVARIDHTAAAKAIGMEMPPTQVLLFANPKLGTPLMQAAPTIAIDLPLKVLAWQGADGKVRLAYTTPAALKARHSVTGRDDSFQAMTQALAGMTKLASGN